MDPLLLSRLLSISLISVFFAVNVQAATAQYKKQEQMYKQLCSSLDRPNVDCQCVAKSHATYAHLSPNQLYADYLIETYKERIGQVHQVERAFEHYAGERSRNDIQIEMYNAFSEYESADPFFEEVAGCVIPNADKVSLAPLPTAPIFKEVFDYRVSSTGTERLEQCQLVELNRVLNPQELAALHYVYYRVIEGEQLSRKLNLSQSQSRELANKARQKLTSYEQSTLNIGNYCSALLAAEENSTGNIIRRFTRSDAQRAGSPLNLEKIDINKPRPALSNKFAGVITGIQTEIEDIRAKQANQPSVQEQIEGNRDFQKAKGLKNTAAANATPSLLSRGCAGSGKSDVFCSCFVENFMSDIGEAGGAAALPIIQDGITNSETMGLMQSVDQSRYMQDMSKAQAISVKCENAESSQNTVELSSVTGSAQERYTAVCVFDNAESAEICECAAKQLANVLSERELNILTNMEISQRQSDESDLSSLAADLGMSESQIMQEIVTNPKIMRASMSIMGACM